MKRSFYTILIGGGLFAIAAFLVFNFLPILPPSEKYSITVNPILVKDAMGTETHVAIKNTGKDSLTNVTVYYGGPTKPDVIPILHPGEKINLSPPRGSDLSVVKVTTNEGIDVTEPYEIPASAPFVGNSGYGG